MMLQNDADVRLQDYLQARDRHRKRFLIASAVLLTLLVVGIGYQAWKFVRHLSAAARLESKGLMVDWYFEDGSYWKGGSSDVTYQHRRNDSPIALTRDDFVLLSEIYPVRRLELTNYEDLNDSDVDKIARCTDLRELRLGHDDVKSLRPSRTRLTDKIVDPLSQLTELRVLALAGIPITDAKLSLLAKLQNLEDLDLDGTAITDAGLPQLLALPNLRHLRIAKTRVSDEAAADFQKKAPRVTILRVSE